MNKFYGKYRAIVTKINDPECRGRIKVLCPSVYGEFESPWCLPCVPFTVDSGGTFFIPHIDEVIWIEFEEGDSQYPIWVGGWWAKEKAPLDKSKYPSEVDLHRIIQTRSGHKIELIDKEGAEQIKIRHKSGSEIRFETSGIININVGAGTSDLEIQDDLVTVRGSLKVLGSISSDTFISANGNISAGGNISATGRVSGTNI